KAALQKDLDKAQELLDAKLAAEKAEKDAEAAAKKAVEELFQTNNPATGVIKDTTNQGAIDAAQKLVDKVTDPTIKAALQKDLDKAQALFDLQNSTNTPEFIAAKQAVEGLLTSLVSFAQKGQQTDAYGAVKLDTTQAKIYAAQDKLDLVSDQVVEKAALTAQLAKAQDLL
ncbi:toxin Cry1Ac domain D-VI-related protein, partial [Listeria booriae]|uniref:toxin Cry1Ac domain D-VI-related protein n=1 Tax=Listeria booriae TaxID=1552123 RepID=UPI0017BE81A5